MLHGLNRRTLSEVANFHPNSLVDQPRLISLRSSGADLRKGCFRIPKMESTPPHAPTIPCRKSAEDFRFVGEGWYDGGAGFDRIRLPNANPKKEPSAVKKPYQIVTRPAKESPAVVEQFCQSNGQILLPIVNLLEAPAK